LADFFVVKYVYRRPSRRNDIEIVKMQMVVWV